MTILIGGAETGLRNSSLDLLGRNDQTSTASTDNGDQMFVNVASGNLVYRHQDTFLPSRGEDYEFIRTYNSRGGFGAAGAFNDQRWDSSTDVRLEVASVGGQTVYRLSYGDGSVSEFRLDASSGRYVSTDGSQAFETLEVQGSPVTAYVVTRADNSKLRFSTAGRLLGAVDTNGVGMSYAYDGAGNLQSVTDDLGHVLSYSYVGGKLASIVDETNVVLASYTYDGNGRLSQVTDRRGHVTGYVYDSEGYLLTIRLPSQQTVAGKLVSFAEREINFTWTTVDWPGPSGRIGKVLTKIRDAEGKETLFSYTVSQSGGAYAGGSTTVEDANHQTMTYWYGADGAITRVRDQEGFETAYGYDAKGNLTSVTDRNGWAAANSDSDYCKDLRQTLGFARDLASLSLADKEALLEKFTTRAIYDDRGNLLTRRDNSGNTTTWTYTAFNKVSSVLSPEGGLGEFFYDARQNLIAQIDPGGDLTRFTYDAYGNQVSKTVYLAKSRVVTAGLKTTNSAKVTFTATEHGFADGQAVVFTTSGQLPAGLTVGRTYYVKRLSANSFQLSWTLGGSAITFAANGNGSGSFRVVAEASKQLSTYVYNAFGNLASVTDGEGNRNSFIYDHFGNLTRSKDAAGNTTFYTYDADNRLISVKEPLGVFARTTGFVYDAVGNRIGVTDANGITTASIYDRNNQLLATVENAGRSATANARLSVSTFLLFTLTGHGFVNGQAVVFNTTGQLPAGLVAGRRYYVIVKSADHFCLSATPGGAAIQYGANGAGNGSFLVSDAGKEQRRTEVQVDDVGNRTSVTDAEGRVTTYAYNARRELVLIKTAAVDDDANAATAAVQYTGTIGYDAEGNRIAVTDNRGVTTRYQYTQDGLLRLETTANGQITQYSYDRNQNLLSVVAGLQLEVSKRQITRYGYDAENQRVSVTDAKGNVTTYAYDSPGNVVEIQDANFNVSNLIYDRANRLRFEVSAEVTDPVTGLPTRYTVEHRFDANGNEIETIDQNGHSTLYAYDTLNRRARVTDANSITTSYRYDSNDNVLELRITAGGADAPSHVSTYAYDQFNQLIAETDGVGNALVGSDASMYQTLRKELGYTVAEGPGTRGKLVAELSDAEKTALLLAFTKRYTYDKVGNLTTEADHLGRTTSFDYDALDRMVRSTDAMGGTQQYRLDTGTGQLVLETAVSGTRQYRYDGNGNLLSETDELGRVSSYTYDSMGREETRSDPLGTGSASTVTRTVYDTFGNVKSITDAFGTADARSSSYEYDLNNLLTAAVDARGNRTSYAYDAVGNRIRETDARLNSTTFTYDALDRVVKVRDPLSVETRFEYDGVGNRIAMVDARGTRTRMEFDPGNRMTTMTDGEGRKTVFGYDALGNTITVTTGAGTTGAGALGAETTRYEYDAENNLRKVVDALGNSTTAGFDRVYNQTSVTDARGNTTTTAFDALNRAVLVTDALGGTVRSTYDATGNVLSVKDENGSITRYAYDRANQVITETDALGVQTTYGYDAFGGTTTITRAANRPGETRVQRFSYDANGNVTQETDAAGGIKAYVYDANNTLIRATDENGSATTYGYDANNRVSTITDPLGGITRYSYDANGNRTVVEDANGGKTTAYYNADNELALTVDALGYATAYVYDANGNITGKTQYGTALTMPVNPASQPVPVANAALDRTMGMSHDALNRVSAMTDALGCVTRYSYDANGNRTVVEDANGNRTISYFDANNRLTLSVDALGYATSFAYDAAGNITRQTRYAAPLSLPVDPAVKPTPAVTSAEDRASSAYYDANSRLSLSVDALGYATGYVYDAVGNVTQQTQYATALSLPVSLAVKPVPVNSADDRSSSAYFDANDRLRLSVNALGYATAYVYDAVGNVTQQTQYATALSLPVDLAVKPTPASDAKDRVTTSLFDANNRLTRSVDAMGYVTDYGYDAVGNLTQQTLYSTIIGVPDRITTSYFDGNNRLSLEVDALGHATGYVYDAVGNVTQQTQYETALTGYTPGTKPVPATNARDRTTTFYYDADNRLALSVDAVGYATAYVYDAVGNVTQQTQYETALGSYAIGTRPVPTTNAKDRNTRFSYDRLNRQIKVLDATGQSTRFFYDAFTNLIVVEDPNGVMTFNIHDRGNRLEYSVVAKPRSTITAQFPDGQVWGRVNLEAYFIPNFVNGFSANNGIKTSYTYDAANPAWVASTTVKFGDGTGTATVMQYSYDKLGRITREQGTDGSYRTFRHDELGEVLELDDNGIVTLYTYDLLGRETSRTREQSAGTGTGNTETRSYDAAGNLVYSTDERGNATSYFYDGANRLEKTLGAAGELTRYTYDAVGNVLSITNPGNGVQLFAYDAVNRVVSSLSEGFYLTVYEYDAAGNETVRREYGLTYYVPENGPLPSPRFDDTSPRVTQSTWDSMNRLASRTDGDGLITTYSYDAAGNPTGSTTRTAASTARSEGTLGYDSNDRIIRQVDAAGMVTTYTLNAVGNVLVKVEAAGTAGARTTTYTYDQGGTRLRSETTAAGRLTRYEYEGGSDRLTHKTVEDAADATHTILHAETWSYYANGELQLYVNAVGMRTAYTWEGGFKKSITYAEGTADAYTVTYSYDSKNRLVQEDTGVLFEGQMVSVRYAYDSNDNLTVKTEAAGIVGQERITRYAYDTQNRLIKMTDAEGGITRYFYDSLGNETIVQDPNGVMTFKLYDASGRLDYSLSGKPDPAIYAQLPDGMQLTREYLEAAFVPYLTGFSARGGIKTSYTYDAAKPELVASKTVAFADGTGDAHTTRYTYDVLGRQTTATDAEGFTTSFEYDAFGNLTKETKGQYLLASSVQKTDAELWVSSDYDPAKPPLVEGNTYFDGARVWTAVGQYWIVLGALSPEQRSGLNRAHPQTTTFVYDAADNLIESVDGNGNATTATYDVLGYKQSVTTGVKTGSSSSQLHSFTTEYDWYADGTLKEQRDADGGITRIVRNSLGLQTRVSVLQRYYYDSVYSGSGGYTVVQVELCSITDFTYLTGRRLHTETQNSGTSTVVKTIAYDAFGNITGNTLASAQASDVRATSMRYDRLDRLTSQVDPMGGTTAYTYDAAGNLKSVTDANGAVTRYYYDDYNRLRAEIDAEGYLTEYTRDAFGNCVAKTLFSSKPGGVTDTAYTPGISANDRSTLYTFDGNNTLRTQTESSGLKKTWTYDGAGNLKTAVSSVTNAAQALKNLTESLADRTESWSYDNAGQRTGYVSVDGVVESFTYDSAGNQIQERISNPQQLANGQSEPVHITDYTYDAMNRLTSWDSGTLRRTFSYDFAGNKIEEQDGLNHATTYTYDLLNRLVEVRDAEGVKRGFSYHAYGQIESEFVYDGDTKVVQRIYEYDRNNRLIKETGPTYDTYSVDAQGVGTATADDSGVVTYAYDAVGNLKTRTDERGFVTTHWYDKRGSVIATLSGELILQRFSYNAFNEVATVSTDRKPGGTNGLGVSRSSATPPGLSDAIVITNTLDTMGHVTRTTYPLIDVTSVDPVTRAVTVTQAQPFESSAYDAWGNLVRSTDRNGEMSYAFFDARGRVTAAVDGDGYLTQTAYDSHGNVVLQTRYETPVVVSTAARPTSPALGQTQIVTRVYNAENQLIKEISPEVNTESGFLRANTTFLYDAAGNLVQKTFDISADEQRSESYAYDNVNRLASVRSEEGVLTVLTRDYLGNVTSRYQYSNPEGLAVKNKFFDKETRYTYNRAGLLIRESEYVYGEDPASTENGEQWFSTLYSYDIVGNKTRKQVGDIDVNGQMKPVAQSDGNVYARVFESFWRYNEAGKEILSAAADERRSYNAFFVAGARRYTEYDTSGRITKTWQVDPAAPTVQYKLFELEYNAIGAVINTNAGDGIWRQFGVDANGNKVVSRLTGTKNETTGALVVYDVYDARGNNTRHVNEIGAITETVFDYLGRVTARKLPGALASSLNTTTYTYDSAGNLVSDVNPVGVSQTHYYNLRGQKVLSVFGEGNKQKWSYDDTTGHIYASWFEDTAGVMELSSVKYFRTDAFGRITRVIEGASGALAQAVADYDVDQRDNLRSVREIRAASNSAITESCYTRYWYDSRGNEILMQDGAGNFFGKHYNALGLVDEEGHWGWVPYQPIVSPVDWSTDPTNFSVFTGPSSKAAAFGTQYRTSFESRYDAFGNLTLTTVGRHEETRYDTYGRKTSKYTFGGARKVLSFQYDRFGRLEFETGTSTYKIFTGATLSSPSATIFTQYQYDDAGRVIKIHDRALKTLTEYEYDYANNITQEWFGDGASTNAIAIDQHVSNINKIRHTETTYDAGNRVSSQREWLSGFRVAYSYDLNNRISRRDTFYIEPGQFGQTQGAINLLDRFSFTYDAANRILNDGEYTYTYDSQGRRASALKNGETLATTYAYTNNGLLKSATKGTSVDTWTYDGAGNVASATIAGTATTYSRDAAGRVWKTVSGQAKTFSQLDDYGNAIQTCVFSDTADTGLTTDNADSQTWYINEDFDGDQAKSQGRVFSATGGGTVANAYVSYDAQGRRVKADESGVITTYEYDSAGNVLAVTDAGVTTRYLYSNGKRWGEYAVPTTGVAISFTAYSISRQPGAEFPSISTDRHTVQDGETLRSIAMQYFGSADLWYVIAEANGLTGTEALQRGDTLRIPATTANEYRTAGTFLPAKGLVGLVAPAPTAAEGDNCAQIAVIVAVVLVAIAAVALTIVTVGAAAPAAVTAIGATVALGTAGSIAVGVTVGVVIGAAIAFAASALTQYLLVSGGLQESWDWNQVAVDTAVGGVLGALAGGQAVFSALSVAGKVAALSRTTKVALAIGEVSLDVATEAASQAAMNNGRIPNPEYLGYSAAGAVGGEVLGRGVGAIAKAVKKSRAVNAATAALESRKGLRIADDPIVGPRFEQVLREQSAGENLAFLKASRNLRDLDLSSAEARLEAERIQRVFVRDGAEELDYRATPAQLAEFNARAATEANTPVNIGSLTRENLLQSAPGSPKWFNDLAKAEKEASSMLQDRVDPFRRLVEEEQLVRGYERDIYRPSAGQSVKSKASSAFNAVSGGAASAWGSVRRGASARLDAAADVAAGVYASYKVNAALRNLRPNSGEAISPALRRADDIQAFVSQEGVSLGLPRRIFDDAEVGPMIRGAVKTGYVEENARFLDDVVRFRGAGAAERPDMARRILNEYVNQDSPSQLNLSNEFRDQTSAKIDSGAFGADLFDDGERQVFQGLNDAGAASDLVRRRPEVASLRDRLAAQKPLLEEALKKRNAMLKSPLDRLAAASPMVKSKSAQNALSAGYFDNQAAARVTEFARFNMKNASSASEQFYQAWDNPHLREGVIAAGTAQGKFQDENIGFALAARDYQRARLAQDAQGVTDAVAKLSERIPKPYVPGGLDAVDASSAVLEVNMNMKAEALFQRVLRQNDYNTLDAILPTTVNKLIGKEAQDAGRGIGKFLRENDLKAATYARDLRIEDMLGDFGL